jgi:ABC-type sugar transport system, periplasmic component
MFRFIGRLLMALALIGLGLAGCRPATPAPVTLTIIMEQVPDTDVIQKLLPEFEKQNPGIRVTIDAMPYDAMRDKILASFMAPKATYDVIIVDNPWMDEFVTRKLLGASG